ncbi:hypothetical protein BJ138DRAFT_837890 [Hygrophoropsis aurantiaca]|uniref:Uncharacterized protein n=1 Tax=Hygrophoropsis aurantiaca TaxID=72124 RepID=A0ACB7ZW96_9AGAM|nr:hypothetical protein BJ138DRAFT_837890 [Hygrophoropsis aurantiaca]
MIAPPHTATSDIYLPINVSSFIYFITPRRSSSPVDFLPNELLSAIFTLATHGSHDFNHTVSFPITLSHVCRHWRDVSAATSSLWTAILLTHPGKQSQLSRTVHWLGRSRNRPLQIRLDFRDPSWNWDEMSHSFGWKNMENVMRLLLPHVSRWESLHLFTDTWAPIFTFLWYSSRVKVAPMLKDIQLSRCNAFFATKGEVFSPAAMSSPIGWFDGGRAFTGLRRVSLAGVHVDWANSGLSGLLELELKYHTSDVMPTLSQFSDILMASPRMEKLTIIGWGPQLDVEEVARHKNIVKLQRSIQLLHLTEFNFGFLDVEYAIDILSLFYFPNLKHFSLEDFSSLDPSQPQDATPLLEYLISIHNSPCPSPSPSHSSTCCISQSFPLSRISSLELHSLVASDSTIRRFLLQFRTLRTIDIVNFDHRSVRNLSAEIFDGQAPPCPDLADVTYRYIDDSTIAELLSLWKVAGRRSPSRRISLDLRDADAAPDDQQAADLRLAGVHLLE